VLVELNLAPAEVGHAILAAVVAMNGYLLYRFFRGRAP
jgi:hypothetical protein